MGSWKTPFLWLLLIAAPLIAEDRIDPLILLWEGSSAFSDRSALMASASLQQDPQMTAFIDYVAQTLQISPRGEEEYLLSRLLERCRSRETGEDWGFTEANRGALIRLLTNFEGHERTELRAALLPFTALLAPGEQISLLIGEARRFRFILGENHGMLPPVMYPEVQRWSDAATPSGAEQALKTEVLRLYETSGDYWLSGIIKNLLEIF